MKSGVYQILNIVNGKRYIGSSSDVKRRLSGHLCELKSGNHTNRHLSASLKKYGVVSFVFEIIEYCDIDKLIEREQFYIDKYDPSVLYNKRLKADRNTGQIPWNTGTKGIKAATSGSFKKGVSASPQTQFKKGGKPWNDNTKGVMKAWNKGIKSSLPPWNKGKKGEYTIGNKNKKTTAFEIVSKDSILYIVNGVRPFCREMGLRVQGIFPVIKNKYKQHLGWRLPKDGDVYEGYGFFGDVPEEKLVV